MIFTSISVCDILLYYKQTDKQTDQNWSGTLGCGFTRRKLLLCMYVCFSDLVEYSRVVLLHSKL